MEIHTYCRLCERSCGLLAELQDGSLKNLRPDPSDPICGDAENCGTLERSISALSAEGRITQPMRRQGDRLVPASWDEALSDISARLAEIRSRSGSQGLGLLLGETLDRNSAGMIRSLSLALSLGTTRIFSDLSQKAGPRVRMAELMLGHPVSLLTDLSRAHYVVVFGGHQPEGDWGPWTLGGAYERQLQHSRKTKGAKVVVVGPCKTPLAESMDQFVAIRPGSEPFMMLGMLIAVVHSGWVDQQYLDDYTSGYEELQTALEAWTIDDCARICGIEAAQLSGIALKFSRSAMSVVHPDYGTFSNAHTTLGVWAWMALHTVTANTLRPGGLYDHQGVVDIQSLLDYLPTEGAPRTRVLDIPLLLMQGPAAALADEILVPGEGRVSALICVASDPVSNLPDSGRTREALDSLDLFVCLARHENQSTAHADWVLPTTHPWERQDLQLMDHRLLPRTMLRWTPALVEPAGQARTEQDILGDLAGRLKAGNSDSSWGRHVHMLGRFLSRSDLETWMRRMVGWSSEFDWSELESAPHRVDEGDTDRSAWRVATESERIDLVPSVALDALRALSLPAEDLEFPIWLRTSLRTDAAPDPAHRAADYVDPGLSLHPELGIPDGARVRVTTRHGSIETTAHHEPSLRPDSADLPARHGSDVMALLSASRLDGLCGTAAFDGLTCRVEIC
jgi:anaerobic selenocysteine-containing dehydrogenase